jgi:multidrug efflux system outer membrane protein
MMTLMNPRLFILLVLVFSIESAISSPSTYTITGKQRYSKKFTVDVKSLQKRLLESNIGVLRGAVQLHASKDQVGIARGNLLPSLNLGVALQSFANPLFSISSVEFLVPFLLPSRWFDYFSQKNIYRADKEAFVALGLNSFASAYSLYQLLLSDFAVRDVLRLEIVDLEAIVALAEARYSSGLSGAEEVDSAKADLAEAQIRLNKFEAAMLEQIFSLRKALGFGSETQMLFSANRVPDSSYESRPVRSVIDRALYLAPENYQLKYLLESAKNEKWSKVFSFLNSLSVSSNGFSSNPGANGGLNIGFGYLPAVNLSSRKAEDVLLQQEDLYLEFTRVIETTQNKINKAKEDINLADTAEDHRENIYQITFQNYQLGKVAVTDVLDARQDVRDAALEKISTHRELNNLRVAFHRSMLTDSFAKIGFCSDPPDSEGRGWFRRNRNEADSIQRPKMPVSGVVCNEAALNGK